jgi:hypothetical protein
MYFSPPRTQQQHRSLQASARREANTRARSTFRVTGSTALSVDQSRRQSFEVASHIPATRLVSFGHGHHPLEVAIPYTNGLAVVASKLVASLRERHKDESAEDLEEMLPDFEAGAYTYTDLVPFLQSVSTPLTRDTAQNNPKRKVHSGTRNSDEQDKNGWLRCPATRERDIDIIGALSTEKCRCASHKTLSNDDVRAVRGERAGLNCREKKDQVFAILEEFVKVDRFGVRSMTGKKTLCGQAYCPQVWKLILKVQL